jgi:hypothetical protein
MLGIVRLESECVDFKADTIRVDESADQRMYKIGPCKNAATYRTVLLADSQSKEALSTLKPFLKGPHSSSALVFRSKRGCPLRETISEYADRKCVESRSVYSPLIVPPTFYKDLNNVFLSSIWNRTDVTLCKVKHIVFCGYFLS